MNNDFSIRTGAIVLFQNQGRVATHGIEDIQVGYKLFPIDRHIELTATDLTKVDIVFSKTQCDFIRSIGEQTRDGVSKVRARTVTFESFRNLLILNWDTLNLRIVIGSPIGTTDIWFVFFFNTGVNEYFR